MYNTNNTQWLAGHVLWHAVTTLKKHSNNSNYVAEQLRWCLSDAHSIKIWVAGDADMPAICSAVPLVKATCAWHAVQQGQACRVEMACHGLWSGKPQVEQSCIGVSLNNRT